VSIITIWRPFTTTPHSWRSHSSLVGDGGENSTREMKMNWVKTKSRPKYTTISGTTTTTFFTRFRITVNFTTFRKITCIFESTSSFWILLPVHWFRFVAPGFLTGSIIVVCLRYGSHTGQNKSKRSVPGALEAKPEIEIWRRPDFLNRRPRIGMRTPIHYGVYLAPLRSFRELNEK